MNLGGLPCRVHTCRATFAVKDGGSMDSLKVAARLRDQHEVEAHAYQHVVTISAADQFMPLVPMRVKRRAAADPS